MAHSCVADLKGKKLLNLQLWRERLLMQLIPYLLLIILILLLKAWFYKKKNGLIAVLTS